MAFQPVLVVEDVEVTREFLVKTLNSAGFRAVGASDGKEAWHVLETNPEGFDAVLLDRMMPRMSGLELLERIKRHRILNAVPVILQTALTSRADTLEGLEAGAYYYLTKPVDREALTAIVRTAMNDHQRYRQLREEVQRLDEAFELMRAATFQCRTLEDCMNVAILLAKSCPDPEKAVVGLSEILVNGVEHGNLGITYEEKSVLNEAGRWNAEVDRRLSLPENAEKRVTVRLEQRADAVHFSIEDEGDGFDWESYLEVEPERLFDNHGRGIAMSRLASFDDMTYNDKGNRVDAVVRRES